MGALQSADFRRAAEAFHMAHHAAVAAACPEADDGEIPLEMALLHQGYQQLVSEHVLTPAMNPGLSLFALCVSATLLQCAVARPLKSTFCTASSTDLNLTALAGGRFAATTEDELARLCQCRDVDYFHLDGCSECSQETLDTCVLARIRGSDPVYGTSLLLDTMPQIRSLAGFQPLYSRLPGGLRECRL